MTVVLVLTETDGGVYDCGVVLTVRMMVTCMTVVLF